MVSQTQEGRIQFRLPYIFSTLMVKSIAKQEFWLCFYLLPKQPKVGRGVTLASKNLNKYVQLKVWFSRYVQSENASMRKIKCKAYEASKTLFYSGLLPNSTPTSTPQETLLRNSTIIYSKITT